MRKELIVESDAIVLFGERNSGGNGADTFTGKSSGRVVADGAQSGSIQDTKAS